MKIRDKRREPAYKDLIRSLHGHEDRVRNSSEDETTAKGDNVPLPREKSPQHEPHRPEPNINIAHDLELRDTSDHMPHPPDMAVGQETPNLPSHGTEWIVQLVDQALAKIPPDDTYFYEYRDLYNTSSSS